MARLPNSQSTALISQRDSVSAGLPPDAQPKSLVYEYPWEYFAVKNGEWDKLTNAERTLGATVFKALHPNEAVPRGSKEVVGTKPDLIRIDEEKAPVPRRIVKPRVTSVAPNKGPIPAIEALLPLLDNGDKLELLTKLATELGMEIE